MCGAAAAAYAVGKWILQSHQKWAPIVDTPLFHKGVMILRKVINKWLSVASRMDCFAATVTCTRQPCFPLILLLLQVNQLMNTFMSELGVSEGQLTEACAKSKNLGAKQEVQEVK